jgi:ribosome-binding factor A
MSGNRQDKVARLVQKDLGDIFIREEQSLFNGFRLTATVVRVTADLSRARVYVSYFHPGADPEDVLAMVRSRKSAIRGELGNRVRNQLRKVPELEFYYDDSADYAEKIDRLLKK